jgi:hypothetical protein
VNGLAHISIPSVRVSIFVSPFGCLAHAACVRACVRRLPVMAKVVPSSTIHVSLKIEAVGSFETSVIARATRRKIPQDDILHSHCHETLKSYIVLTGWTL